MSRSFGRLFAALSWLSGFENGARNLGLPVGAIVVGIALGGLLYAVLRSLAGRPFTEGAGTVRISMFSETNDSVRPRATGGTAPVPTYSRYRPVQLYTRDSVRTVQMVGAGEYPSTPLPRARRFVAVLVGSFLAVALVLLLFYHEIFGAYDHVVAATGAVLYWPLPWPGVYAVSATTLIVPDYIFPMYLAGMAAFAVASGLVTNRPRIARRRRLLALSVVLVYVGIGLVLDALFFTVPGSSLRNFALIVRAFTGGLFMALLVFCATYLPLPQRIVPRFARDRGAVGRFFGLAILAFALSTAALLGVSAILRFQGVVLVFTLLLLVPVLTLELFALLARPVYFLGLRRRPLPPVALYHPSVSILMPAYNEEAWIEGAILSADRAAAHYPGPVEIIVGNDGSTDRTLELARNALKLLQHAKGSVVDLPHGGKSNALNGALAAATGEIVLRCDGDTYISETPGFAAIIPHFADPEVGGVQGAIHPRQTNGWTRKLRALEIAWNHYFLRPPAMGTRSAEVIDGLFSAFRRADLVELGGWVPWNGEDTELSIRIQRLGYRIRFEFGALAFEDVPHNYDTLRRQRVRWARGVLMANGQHYPALLGATPEFAGLGVFFWFVMFVRSGVRSLVYPFLALLILVLGVPAILDTGILLALAIGIRAGPLGYYLVKMKRPDVLPWIPFFPFANIVKQTFRFEAYGTLGPGAVVEYV